MIFMACGLRLEEPFELGGFAQGVFPLFIAHQKIRAGPQGGDFMLRRKRISFS
jgi:hypothetical protein